MKKYLLLSALAALFLFSGCGKNQEASYPYELHFITESYKPLNYLENDTLKGLAPDLLHAVCDGLHIPYSVSVLPWEQGYDQALADDHAVLFSTVLNADRKDLFKWAGPIATLDWFFYSASSRRVELVTQDDALKVGRIGVIRDYSITQTLTGLGFSNLVYCDDLTDAFTKLLNGDIDLFPSDPVTTGAILQDMGWSPYAVTPELIIRTDLIYFAFNKNVPDNVVADFQHQIDLTKTNGVLRNLTGRYLKKNTFPGTLQVYTENYPPITFRSGNGDVTGYGSDIATEIMKRNHIYPDISLTFWSIGYQVALDNPNVCLFTMDRTPLRENLFQWVGPIGTNTTWIFTKAGSGLTVNSLEEARSIDRLGAVSSWFSAQYLIEQGFTNLLMDLDPRTMAKKLMNGQVDACVCSGVTFPDILRDAGYDDSNVVPVFSLLSTDYYIAFSLTTPATTVAAWQSALDAMKGDGTYDAINQKWFK
jgi:ABC-type amino acid transport substrate-binding protein